MSKRSHLRFLIWIVLLALLASAVITTQAAADDGAPPSDTPAVTAPDDSGTTDSSVARAPDAPAVDEPPATILTDMTDAAETTPVEQDLAPSTDTAPPAEAEPIVPETTADDLSQSPSGADVLPDADGEVVPLTADEAAPAVDLSEVPAGTELVVVDGTGEAVPLASEQAAEIIAAGDPMWCPAGLTVADASCVNAPTVGALIPLLGSKSGAGVIYFTSTYGTNDVTFNGSNVNLDMLTDLTLQGGWNGGTSGTIQYSGSSVFSVPISITNWTAGNVTLKDIEITGVAGGTALNIQTTKKITLTRVKVHNNGGAGASLDTCNLSGGVCTSTGAVLIGNSQFSLNTGGSGLSVSSGGSITLNSVVASGNSQYGAYLDNQYTLTAAAITLTGTNTWVNDANSYDNTFDGNTFSGLFIESRGAVSISNVTASENHDWGAYIDNCQWTGTICRGAGAVTLTGMNIFTANHNGLHVESNGAISASNLVANSNTTSYGAELKNDRASSPQGVTLSGSSQFNFNAAAGLFLQSKGTVTLNNITDLGNGGSYGAYIDNCASTGTVCRGVANVTLTGSNVFQENDGNGLYVLSGGAMTLSNINASWNGTGVGDSGAYLDNCMYDVLHSHCAVVSKAISLNGTNVFNGNTGTGLWVVSGGTIAASNLTASHNKGGPGALLTNSSTGAVGNVSVTGTNFFEDNRKGDGLRISTRGSVTLWNITAIGNGDTHSWGGVNVDNTGGIGKPVSLNGTNNLSGNEEYGLSIESAGGVTINNLTANYNGYYDGVLHQSYGWGATIDNLLGTAGVTLTGVNVFNENYYGGLRVSSRGAIKLNSVTANGNRYYDDVMLQYYGYDGVALYNDQATTAQPVTLSGTNQFNNNVNLGLYISSKGLVTLNSITAIGNLNNHGVWIDNCYSDGSTCRGTGNVMLTGSNVFQDNDGYGVYVVSGGSVTLYNVNASYNGLTSVSGYGVWVDNCVLDAFMACLVTSKSVTLLGTNVFNGNQTSGLYIRSGGVIALSNVTAIGNQSSDGANLTNSYANANGGVTLSGTNLFMDNKNGSGLSVYSLGAITLSNITARNNGTASSGWGLYIDNSTGSSKAVTISTANLSGNKNDGLRVYSAGVITINNLTANDNGLRGAELWTTYNSSTIFSVALNGTNTFEGNGSDGLYVHSSGMIMLNNLNANRNGAIGAQITNINSGSSAPRKVTVTGTLVLTENGRTGLQIDSYGLISLSTLQITASSNGLSGAPGYGVEVDNCQVSGVLCQGTAGVTLAGTSQFNGNLQSGLRIFSGGAITISSTSKLTAICNGMSNNCSETGAITAYGVELHNQAPLSGHPGVNLGGASLFLGNRNMGLWVESLGEIRVNNVTSNYSAIAAGAFLDNQDGGAVGGVYMTGTNTFNQNAASGLSVYSMGAITGSNLNAGNNASNGAILDNSLATSSFDITLTGINSFSSNGGSGVQVLSGGAITLNNVSANHNAGVGAMLQNNYGANTRGVTLQGTSTFNENAQFGLQVLSFGDVSLTKVSAAENAWGGLSVNTTGDITLMCGSFTKNTGSGIQTVNASSITLVGVISVGNTNPDFFNTSPFHVRNCTIP